MLVTVGLIWETLSHGFKQNVLSRLYTFCSVRHCLLTYVCVRSSPVGSSWAYFVHIPEHVLLTLLWRCVPKRAPSPSEYRVFVFFMVCVYLLPGTKGQRSRKLVSSHFLY